MALDDNLASPINLDGLLLSKKLEPLAPEHVTTLAKIEQLNVDAFNEAEVRFSIIDPIVRILGYDKGSIFSADLEHPLKFLDKNLYPDYQFTLWNENFWLIEAKKPRLGSPEFGYDDLRQAVEYSVHPTVNAALVVLCDGIKFEIFDREVSVEAPILRVPIKGLLRDFDKIRAVLEPIQVWFFQKRRIVRLLDKVFNKEFNMHRVEEFSDLLERRLRSKSQLIVENFRQTVKPDSAEQLELALSAPVEDLTELYLFSEQPIQITNAVNNRLVALSQPRSFHVMRRIFPDHPRDANDIYMAQAVTYLIRLGEQRATVEWLPAWLAQGPQGNADLESATRFLLRQCLTYFEDYEPCRLILLAACAVRRIAKFMAISNDTVRQLGSDLHALARHQLPEISWNQIVASPEGQLIGLIDGQTRAATLDFVKRNSAKNGGFLSESAKVRLKAYWQLEEKLLGSLSNYAKLSKERSLGDMSMTEWSSVTYDNLGHTTLCLLHGFPKWKTYVLENHRPLVEILASMGSWAAKEMLGLPIQSDYPTIADAELAKRFFLGNEATLQALRTGYRGQGPATMSGLLR
jgi:hypothetical protein